MHSTLKWVLLLSAFAAQPSYASILFSDDFESQSLAGYTGKSSGAHSGAIVNDPIESDAALTFRNRVGGGDMFTTATFSHASGSYILEFDYYAPASASLDGSGFIGVSTGLAGAHTWLGGTSYGGVLPLVGDGTWNHYVIPFTRATPFHIMLEDFRNPTGDAFFDNLELHGGNVPEPTTFIVWSLLGLVGTGLWRRNRN